MIKNFEQFLNESASNTLDQLKKKYPEALITMESWGDKFPERFSVRLEITTQSGEKEYLGGLKGPVSEKTALEFFERTLDTEYDKYY